MKTAKRMTHNQRAKAIAAREAAVQELVREAKAEAIAAMAGKPTNPARLLKYTAAVEAM